jgi:hypothetical protein
LFVGFHFDCLISMHHTIRRVVGPFACAREMSVIPSSAVNEQGFTGWARAPFPFS